MIEYRPEYTYQAIMDRMLARIDDKYDKREGSMIWDALAPAAYELTFCYTEMMALFEETFPDSASHDYLIRHADEIGLEIYRASPAIVRIKSTPEHVNIPTDARFSFDKINFRILEWEAPGSYLAECETPGEIGNDAMGDIIPIEYVRGLETAEITELVIPGQDEEETEHLRDRYFEALRYKAFGGNVQQYKNEVMAMDGVEGVKITPAWNGGGTVKVTIMSTAKYQRVPTPELLRKVKLDLDPPVGPGQGLGTAPIGHMVTVDPVVGRKIDINFNVAFNPGWDWPKVEQSAIDAIKDYFDGLAEGWMKDNQLVVRISQIEIRLLDLEGVLDVSDTTLNGQDSNMLLGEMEIPELEAINATTI